MERDGGSCSDYLKSEDFTKGGTVYGYSRKIRRVSHSPTPRNEDSFMGGEFTIYDVLFKLPWDSDYRILGEDTMRGHECLVVEASSRIHKNHYNKRRISWVDKNLFIDVHEEQFDREDKLYRVVDKEWEQLKPSNWWVYRQWDVVNLGTQARTIAQFSDWLIDKEYKAENWEPSKMLEEHIWRNPNPKNLPPIIKEVSDLPPQPEIRGEFWNKIGMKPSVKSR